MGETIEIPITGELDLHTFRPAEAAELLTDYFEECLKLGILEVRVVHGKGTGALARTVRAALAKNPLVESVAQDGANWGALTVRLKRSKE